MILTFIKNNWSILVCFVLFYTLSVGVAYYKGRHEEELLQQVNIQQSQIKKLNEVIKTEHEVSAIALKKSIDLDNALKSEERRNDVITNNFKMAEARIDRDNVIRASLLRIISDSNPASVSTSPPPSNQSGQDDRIIPASKYAAWTIGLMHHDNKCVLQLNTLIDYYNRLRNRLNN